MERVTSQTQRSRTWETFATSVEVESWAWAEEKLDKEDEGM